MCKSGCTNLGPLYVERDVDDLHDVMGNQDEPLQALGRDCPHDLLEALVEDHSRKVSMTSVSVEARTELGGSSRSHLGDNPLCVRLN